nr:2-hydroxyacid dehydrogenase [uncultured Acidocella sp.]
MSARSKILSIGGMERRVEEALARDFEVFSSHDESLASLVAAHGKEIEAIVTWGREKTDAALIAALPKLRLISNYGVGYDSVDAHAAAARGVIVTHTPDVLNDEVADFTVALLLATIRQLPQADAYVRGGQWASARFPLSASLRDRSIGIAGLGRIGLTIAKRLDGFGRPIAYHTRTPREGLAYEYHPTLEGLAAAVDTLILVMPGGASTHHAVNAKVLEALGPRGILINVARGSVVDQEALIAALRSRTILSAGLDVFEGEPNVPQALREMTHIVLAPHIGSATEMTRRLMAELVIDNVRSWFAGEGPLTPVPETPWPAKS